jgi:hypothetical protein
MWHPFVRGGVQGRGLPWRKGGATGWGLCLSVKDTALQSLLRTVPPGPDEAFQHAVASELLSDRETLKARGVL